MDLQHQLRMEFPNLRSNGMNHPPSETNQLISQLIGYVQMAGFGLMLGGSFLFSSILKAPEPPLVTWMGENKMNAFCLIFMMGFFSTQLMATGAFEVYYNGNVVYSKLESGQLPHVQEIIRSLEMYGVQRTTAKF
jgi:selT/selW/selH-like putative selenoprotein